MMMTSNRLLYGSDEPLPSQVPLRAGPLTMLFEAGDLRYISLGSRELVRRISGKDIGTFFAEEVAGPLGLEFWIGLPESEESRVAPLIPSPPPPPEMVEMMASFMGPDSLGGRALSLGGALGVEGEMIFNTRGMHGAQIPAANGITNARSLSRMYAACVSEVDGVRLLTPDTVAKVTETLTSGPDQCLVFESTFGLGFMTHGSFTPMMGPGSFGHAGGTPPSRLSVHRACPSICGSPTRGSGRTVSCNCATTLSTRTHRRRRRRKRGRAP